MASLYLLHAHRHETELPTGTDHDRHPERKTIAILGRHHAPTSTSQTCHHEVGRNRRACGSDSHRIWQPSEQHVGRGPRLATECALLP
jgi:hypothetical protein